MAYFMRQHKGVHIGKSVWNFEALDYF